MKNINKIVDEKELEEICSRKKVLIFKNSPSCGISRHARGHLENYAANCDCPVEIYIVDVINERPLSKKIETITGIRHESPQAILLENGTVTWHDSHYHITAQEIKQAVENQNSTF